MDFTSRAGSITNHPALLLALIHPSAWKKSYSRKSAYTILHKSAARHCGQRAFAPQAPNRRLQNIGAWRPSSRSTDTLARSYSLEAHLRKRTSGSAPSSRAAEKRSLFSVHNGTITHSRPTSGEGRFSEVRQKFIPDSSPVHLRFIAADQYVTNNHKLGSPLTETCPGEKERWRRERCERRQRR